MATELLTTVGGHRVDVFNIAPGDFTPRIVAQSLAHKCRFGGFTTPFYSVAQHCVLVSQMCPPQFALQGLLHELDEVFLPDIPRPVKNVILPEWRSLAEDHHITGCFSFGIDPDIPADVHTADVLALYAEAQNFVCGKLALEIAQQHKFDPFEVRITPLGPPEAYTLFKDRLIELTKDHAITRVSN